MASYAPGEEETRMADGWEVVVTVESEEQAQVIAGFLESSGVPCEMDSTHSHEFPTTVGELAVVRLAVPAERAAEARRLLAEREAAGAPGLIDTDEELAEP